MTDTPYQSLQALLHGLIDYAGMFPPASLPLETALLNYLAYLNGEHAWMLAGFILPVNKAMEAVPILEGRQGPWKVKLNMLGSGGRDWQSFFDRLDQDILRINELRKRVSKQVETGIFETRLPGVELDYQIRADALVDRAAKRLNHAGLQAYFEVPASSGWISRLERVITAIDKAAQEIPVRLKIRTGGISSSDIPSSGKLSRAIALTRKRRRPFKLTAGLHHPVRHYDPDVGAKMHGFVNVFAAAALAHVHNLSEDELIRVVNETEPGRFNFDDDGMGWSGLRVSNKEIQEVRRDFTLTVGSCSFDEPREALRALGWIL